MRYVREYGPAFRENCAKSLMHKAMTHWLFPDSGEISAAEWLHASQTRAFQYQTLAAAGFIPAGDTEMKTLIQEQMNILRGQNMEDSQLRNNDPALMGIALLLRQFPEPAFRDWFSSFLHERVYPYHRLRALMLEYLSGLKPFETGSIRPDMGVNGHVFNEQHALYHLFLCFTLKVEADSRVCEQFMIRKWKHMPATTRFENPEDLLTVYVMENCIRQFLRTPAQARKETETLLTALAHSTGKEILFWGYLILILNLLILSAAGFLMAGRLADLHSAWDKARYITICFGGPVAAGMLILRLLYFRRHAAEPDLRLPGLHTLIGKRLLRIWKDKHLK